MVEVEIVCVSITAICGIITSLIGLLVKRSTERSEKRAIRRKKESLLSLQMMDATLELTEATANALLGKTNNGNVEKAYEKTTKAKEDYENFERDILAEEIM